MDLSTLKVLLQGALVMGDLIVAVFFLRYWRASRDRLFLLFAIAFGMLSVNAIAFTLLRAADEETHFLYVVRLAAFVIMLFAIWDKNRKRPA
jgi:peptidoglycan/LPS O-acetylase OafA/YrhL